jgi:hypothetical protein
MKVSIVPGTKSKGLVFKSEIHTVQFSVQFSEEEKAQIKAAGVKNFAVVEDVPFSSGAVMDLEVCMLDDPKGSTAHFENQTASQDFIAVLKASLGNLKQHSETYGEGAEAETFEL